MAEPMPRLRLVRPDDADSGGDPPTTSDVGPANSGPSTATDTAGGPVRGRATGPAGHHDRATGAQATISPGTAARTSDGPVAATANEAGKRTEAANSPAAGGELEPYGRPMTLVERSWRLARHWAASAREEAMRSGGLAHGLIHGRPESLAAQHAYVKSRAWVPDGHDGPLLPGLGAVYGHTLGRAGMCLGYAVAWVFARPMRLALVVVLASAFTLIVALAW